VLEMRRQEVLDNVRELAAPVGVIGSPSVVDDVHGDKPGVRVRSQEDAEAIGKMHRLGRERREAKLIGSHGRADRGERDGEQEG